MPIKCDFVEFALLDRLDVHTQREGRTISLEEARAAVLWALAMDKHPLGAPARPHQWVWLFLARLCVAFVVIIIVLSVLLALTRASFRQVSADGDILIASGVNTYYDEAPVVGTASVLATSDLMHVLSMPADVLRRIRDVVMTHDGIWRCIRIASVMKFSDRHVWLEARDGTGIRLKYDRGFVRFGQLGAEVPFDLVRSNYTGSSEDFPAKEAGFDVVVVLS